jgi:hypothetical protein
VRRPSADDAWLLLGYAVWFCLIYALWQAVTRLPRFR